MRVNRKVLPLPRVRKIRPTYFSDDALAECSHSARWLYVGLTCFCDDMGRMEYSPRALQSYIFPAEGDATIANVVEWLAQLADADLIERYKVERREYLRIVNIADLVLNRPSHSTIPKSPHEHHAACYCAKCKADAFHVERTAAVQAHNGPVAKPLHSDDAQALQNESDALEEPAEGNTHDFVLESDLEGLGAKDRETRRRAIEVFAARMLDALGIPVSLTLTDTVIEAIRVKARHEGLSLEAAGNKVFGPAALLKAQGKAPANWVEYFRGQGAA